MPRLKRVARGGVIYHVLNRANGRTTLFHDDDDYAAFERGKPAPRASAAADAKRDRGASTPPTPGLHPWPVPGPKDWVELVNRPMTGAEERAMRDSIARGRPFGDERWQARTAARLGLQPTLRPR